MNNFPVMIERATKRLLLRQWRPSDFPEFATINADSEVMRFFPAPLTSAQSDALASTMQSTIAQRGWGPWAIELRSSGQFIGVVGLNIPSTTLPFSPCVELLWRLSSKHWGQGYASEAAHEAVRIAFDALQLEELVAFTAVVNLRSQAVMAKLGMQNSGQNFEHPALPIGSPLRMHCLYRLKNSATASS